MKHDCKVCKKEFEGPKQKRYCSDACALKGHRKKQALWQRGYDLKKKPWITCFKCGAKLRERLLNGNRGPHKCDDCVAKKAVERLAKLRENYHRRKRETNSE